MDRPKTRSQTSSSERLKKVKHRLSLSHGSLYSNISGQTSEQPLSPSLMDRPTTRLQAFSSEQGLKIVKPRLSLSNLSQTSEQPLSPSYMDHPTTGSGTRYQMCSSKQRLKKPKLSPSVAKRPPVSSFTIKANGKVVGAGSDVLVRCSKSDKGERVAHILSIEEDPDVKGNLKFNVRWYYWPHETVGGDQPFFGHKEVFLTRQGGHVTADDILDTGYVRPFIQYANLYHVYPQDYLGRFNYDTDTGFFSPPLVPVFCTCQMPINPDEFMLKCGACEKRYHPSCLGMTNDEALQIDNYVCCYKEEMPGVLKCFCPWPSCGFSASSKNLYDHFKTNQSHSALRFNYNSTFFLVVLESDKHLFLQEENDGVIFILNHGINSGTRCFSVDCIGPPEFKKAFAYELGVESDSTYGLKSIPEVYTKWEEHTFEETSHLFVPLSANVLALQVCINKKAGPGDS